MRHLSIKTLLTLLPLATAIPTSSSSSIALNVAKTNDTHISIPLFIGLEELSRIVDISYCVGTSGISHPFKCANRCDEFPDFELVTEFNTGPLMSDSCGFVAVDHGSSGSGGAGGEGHHDGERGGGGGEGKRGGRIIVAFRGTYSIANTIVDLSTVPQEYVPYPGAPGNDSSSPARSHAPIDSTTPGRRHRFLDWLPGFGSPSSGDRPTESKTGEQGGKKKDGEGEEEPLKCKNCTVHSGFWQSWQNTRPFILPHLKAARATYPGYKIHLVGHSLGGAVAALAGLEMDSLGWNPVVTTFGEPKVGNEGLRDYVDGTFGVKGGNGSVVSVGGGEEGGRYRRVTHVDDPVPLLPLVEWGYEPHAGEVFISKSALQPSLGDVRLCSGDQDMECSFGAEAPESWLNGAIADLISPESFSPAPHPANQQPPLPNSVVSGANQASPAQQPADVESMGEVTREELRKRWGIPIPSRYKMWQLFFAHRDYFWRLGLCVKGGDPSDWGREKYRFPGHGEGEGEIPV